MNQNLYEFVPYEQTNYVYQMGDLNYCLPHIHKEYELGIILDGQMHINPRKENVIIHPGEFWLLNPYQCHEFAGKTQQDSYLFLEVQFSKSYFKSYFPQISNMIFEPLRITEDMLGSENYKRLKQLLFSSAEAYFKKEKGYELTCAGDLNYIFYELVQNLSYHIVSQEEQKQTDYRLKRMERILAYIEDHYREKLLLGDIAEKENLTLNYLSHSFKECFGLSFQAYLQNVRCHKAAVMLLETDSSITEISTVCGFSAPKYLKQAFLEIFHITPQEFRKMEDNHTLFEQARMEKGTPEKPNGFPSLNRKSIIHVRRVLPKTLSAEESIRRMNALEL